MVAVFKYLQAHLCILTDTYAAYLRSLPTRPPLVLKLDRNGFHAATARLSDSRSG
jgi:hypothetical protein